MQQNGYCNKTSWTPSAWKIFLISNRGISTFWRYDIPSCENWEGIPLIYCRRHLQASRYCKICLSTAPISNPTTAVDKTVRKLNERWKCVQRWALAISCYFFSFLNIFHYSNGQTSLPKTSKELTAEGDIDPNGSRGKGVQILAGPTFIAAFPVSPWGEKSLVPATHPPNRLSPKSSARQHSATHHSVVISASTPRPPSPLQHKGKARSIRSDHWKIASFRFPSLEAAGIFFPTHHLHLSTKQSWALEVVLNFFSNKKLFFAFCIKLIWLGVDF